MKFIFKKKNLFSITNLLLIGCINYKTITCLLWLGMEKSFSINHFKDHSGYLPFIFCAQTIS